MHESCRSDNLEGFVKTGRSREKKSFFVCLLFPVDHQQDMSDEDVYVSVYVCKCIIFLNRFLVYDNLLSVGEKRGEERMRGMTVRETAVRRKPFSRPVVFEKTGRKEWTTCEAPRHRNEAWELSERSEWSSLQRSVNDESFLNKCVSVPLKINGTSLLFPSNKILPSMCFERTAASLINNWLCNYCVPSIRLLLLVEYSGIQSKNMLA